MNQKNKSEDRNSPPSARGHNFLYVPTDKSDHQLKLIGWIITQMLQRNSKVLTLVLIECYCRIGAVFFSLTLFLAKLT
jgi:hypothetical protein